jgi:hypothetical protein
LSRSNKLPGDGRDEYLKKQRELRGGGINLVEIDLLRSGQRPFLFHPDLLPSAYQTPYLVCVHRGWRPTRVQVFRASLRERLPVIAIPLRQSDDDVALDLQVIIDQCYQNGAYDDDLDYESEPVPPFEEDDAQWADALLRKQGRRTRASRRPVTASRSRKKKKRPPTDE